MQIFVTSGIFHHLWFNGLKFFDPEGKKKSRTFMRVEGEVIEVVTWMQDHILPTHVHRD